MRNPSLSTNRGRASAIHAAAGMRAAVLGRPAHPSGRPGRKASYTGTHGVSTSTPCRRHCAKTASTAGCSTTSTAPIPLRAALPGVNGGKMTTRRWFYFDAGQRAAARAGPRDRAHTPSTTCRATPSSMPAARRWGHGLDTLDARRQTRGDGVLARERHPVRRPRRRGHDRGDSAAGRRSGVLGRSGPAVRRPLERSGAGDAPRRRPQALYRVKDRAFEAIAARLRRGEPTTEYDVQQLMVGWFAEEGLITDSPPLVACMENAGNPHYVPPADGQPHHSPNELVLLDLWGKRDQPGAVYADITWVGFTGAARAGRIRHGLRGRRRRSRRGGRAGAEGGARRQRSSRLAGRSRGADGARATRLRRAFLHRTGHNLGDGSARQRRAHGRLRNPRRPPAAAGHAGSRSNRASISTILEFARRSTSSSAPARHA